LGTSGSTLGWKVFDVSDVVSSSGKYSFGVTSNSANAAKYKTLDAGEDEYYAYLSVETLPQYAPIYVNAAHVNSSDSNNGTIDYPFATVSAAANLIYNNGTIYINGTYNETVPFYGNKNVTVTSYLDGGTISDGITVANVDGLYFNDINISSTTANGIDFLASSGNNITFNNINVNTLPGSVIFRPSSRATNVSFTDCNIISDNSQAGSGIAFTSGALVDGVTINNTYVSATYSFAHGIYFSPSSGSNIDVINSDIYGGENAIMITNVVDNSHPTDILLSRLNVYGGQGRDGGSGIFLRGGENITLENINFIESTYTAMKTTDNFNSTMANNIIYPLGATHNAIEVKGQYNHYYNNTVYWNETSRLFGSNNVFYGAGSQHDHHILFEDAYAEGTRGDFIQTGGHQNNMIYRNVTGVDHHSRAIAVFGNYFSSFDYESGYISSDQILFDNITIGMNAANGDRHIALHTLGSSPGGNVTDQDNYTRDRLTFIDVAIEDRNYEMWGFYDGATALKHHYADVHAINPNAETTYWNINNAARAESVLHFSYYPNIKVVNTLGQAVEGANVSFVSNATNPETGETIYAHNIDYGGVEKAHTDTINSSLTLSDGELPDRYENASGAVALTSSMEYYTTSGQTEYVEWNITATKDGETDTATITPDMLRYSPDSSDSQSDEVILILDVEGTGEAEFIITDFSPSDLTPTITEGTSQTFEITVNNESQINWYVNTVLTEAAGSGLLTDTLSYGIGQDAGEYNVTVTANDGVNEVSKTWTLTITEAAAPVTPTEKTPVDSAETALGLIGVLVVVLIAGTIIVAVYGIYTGIVEPEIALGAVGAMIIVGVLGFLAISILSALANNLGL